MRALLIPPDSSALRENHFNTMRLTMALLVVWSHSFALFLGSEDTEPVSRVMNGTYNAGNIGVLVFFVISGFLITHSYQRSKSLGDYLSRRIRRIHPGFVVATAVCAFVIVPFYSTQLRLDETEVIKVIGLNALLQGYFPSSDAFALNPHPNAVNGSLWSIPFEFWCYIGVAAFGLIGLAKARWLLVVAVMTVISARIVLDLLGLKPGLGIIGTIVGWPYLWTVVLPCFLLGMIAYNMRDILPRSHAILIGLLFASVCAAWTSEHLAHLIFPLAMAYAVFYFAFLKVEILDAARWGDFSYGTYLYAFPIQQMLAASYLDDLTFWQLLSLSMTLSLAAGVLSWHLVEKHFLKLPKRQPRAMPLDGAANVVAP